MKHIVFGCCCFLRHRSPALLPLLVVFWSVFGGLWNGGVVVAAADACGCPPLPGCPAARLPAAAPVAPAAPAQPPTAQATDAQGIKPDDAESHWLHKPAQQAAPATQPLAAMLRLTVGLVVVVGVIVALAWATKKMAAETFFSTDIRGPATAAGLGIGIVGLEAPSHAAAVRHALDRRWCQ